MKKALPEFELDGRNKILNFEDGRNRISMKVRRLFALQVDLLTSAKDT